MVVIRSGSWLDLKVFSNLNNPVLLKLHQLNRISMEITSWLSKVKVLIFPGLNYLGPRL